MPLIVPSPMTAPMGRKKSGGLSAHTLDNTGPRKFLVVEFDFKEKGKDELDTADAPLLQSLAADEFLWQRMRGAARPPFATRPSRACRPQRR